MVTAFEVPAAQLIDAITADLKEKFEMPKWAQNVKTGSHTQRPPTQADWYYVRVASILRRLYTQGPIGIERLRTVYGGRKSRGSRPNKHCRGGGKIIRTALQQLEELKLVKKTPRGRKLSPQGVSYVDGMALKASK